MQDGIPVQSSGFFNHNALAYTSFESASDVEVLKGAGTALYGSDAVSAVVNVGSAKPDGSKESAVRLQGGSYGYKHAFAKNLGTMGEVTNYNVSVSYTDNDGYRDHSSYTRAEVNAKFITMLNEDNILETAFNYTNSDAEQTGVLTKEQMYNDPKSVGDIESKMDKVDPQRKFDFARLSLKWDNYSYEDIDISTIFYLRDTRNRYTATWENNLPENDSEQKSVGLMHKSTQKVSWGTNVYGLDMEYTQGTLQYIQSFDYVPSGWGTPVDAGLIYDYDVDYVALAPYFQTNIPIGEHFEVEAGLRYDYNSFDYTNNTGVGQYGESSYYRPADRTDSFNHFSPKLALAYHLNKQQEFYLRYANSFRIPSATRLYSQKTGTTVEGLDPETSDTYEVGYKQAFEHAYVALVGYYMNIDDTIVRREDSNGDRYYENGRKSTHKGVELTYKQQIGEMFALSLAESYSKSNYDNDPVYGDNEMVAAPNYKGNFRLFFTPNSQLNVMAEVQYVGSYYMDDENVHEYGGYTIFNLKADYEMGKHWKLFVKADNITDKVYAQKADYAYGKEKYTPGLPQMFYAGLEYKF
ncbi:MAG: TonB-dependent receptor [Sulfurovum sp.]|nr:TonB-dependent receptor [Sulfurovum sp.]